MRLDRMFVSAVACLACWTSTPVAAEAMLNTSIANISCGITSPEGTVMGECDTLSFAVSIAPGETAFLRGTLNYHYTDDGLRLPTPGGIQRDTLGGMIFSEYEMGAVHVISSFCGGARFCGHPVYLTETGLPFTPLVLGQNDHPDDITGSLDVFVTIGFPANLQGGWSGTLFIGASPQVLSAPVPEPAAVTLMGIGLLVTGIAACRRRCAA